MAPLPQILNEYGLAMLATLARSDAMEAFDVLYVLREA
jgi:hypothetical protein